MKDLVLVLDLKINISYKDFELNLVYTFGSALLLDQHSILTINALN